MSMNSVPSGERVHIGIFGRRNAGKSSLINAITGQKLAVVSDIRGTTTDPVKKAMELLPLGPVVMIDTPGLDDTGELGEERVKKARQILRQTDLALLVVAADSAEDLEVERELLDEVRRRQIPFLVVVNKCDLLENADEKAMENRVAEALRLESDNILTVSSDSGTGIRQLKEAIGHLLVKKEEDRPLIRDLLAPGDLVVLVVPIDSAAPKGRLILPQQQVIRDALEAGAIPVVTRETELKQALAGLVKPPRMVVTDSQVFGRVAKEVPEEIPLTSFSILMARYKGDLKTQVEGARAIENLKDGDTVLISEGCTHHRQCEDIGTVKMPAWIRKYTGKDIRFAFTSGGTFPEDLSGYALVVHCGGCMLNTREMRSRISMGAEAGVPITNYGVMIAYIHGILDRVTFPMLY